MVSRNSESEFTMAVSENNDVQQKSVNISNPHIKKLDDDVMYHFALSTKADDFPKMFGDVKFVVVGGSSRRMESFAHFMQQELNISLAAGQTLVNISKTDRYALFKVGPVMAASHGMGIPSFSIMMHEIIKILHHAHATDIIMFRMGTSGGIGITPGTVVVSTGTCNGLFSPTHELIILGKVHQFPAMLDQNLAQEMIQMSQQEDLFETIGGSTMCTMDFYEGQGRLDGAFCDYQEKEKQAFLWEAHKAGIRNIEMESLCFAAMCHRAQIKGIVTCVTLLDRLRGDQVKLSREKLTEYGQRPAILIARFIKEKLSI